MSKRMFNLLLAVLMVVAVVLGVGLYFLLSPGYYRDLSEVTQVAPNWTQATNIAGYGWAAFGFAVGGIVLYFLGLMCTHLAAFRTASNIRRQSAAGFSPGKHSLRSHIASDVMRCGLRSVGDVLPGVSLMS